MPRNDNVVASIKELPHLIEVDPNSEIVGLTLRKARFILNKAPRPAEAFGLYMAYRTLYQERKHVPSVPTLLKELGWGKDKLTKIRSILKELGLIEDVRFKDKKTNRFIATITVLREPGFPGAGKDLPYIINNIYTPDSATQKSGRVCSSCSCSEEKKEPPKNKFPREQDFHSLWEANRRKINKEEARKAWKSKKVQKELPPRDALLEAYEADAASNKWDKRKDDGEEEFIPHLSTWLRNKRWKNYTGEPAGGKAGTLHIMTQLKRSDGIRDARHLRKELLAEYPSKAPKKLIRAYVKWLAGPDSPPATPKDSIRDVLVRSRAADSKYYNAFTKTDVEPF